MADFTDNHKGYLLHQAQTENLREVHGNSRRESALTVFLRFRHLDKESGAFPHAETGLFLQRNGAIPAGESVCSGKEVERLLNYYYCFEQGTISTYIETNSERIRMKWK